jgi:hypothetical protein
VLSPGNDLLSLSLLVFGVVIGKRSERLLGLPLHVWIGGAALPILVVLHEAEARHIEVVPRVVAVRLDLRREFKDERPVDPCAIQDAQGLAESNESLLIVN